MDTELRHRSRLPAEKQSEDAFKERKKSMRTSHWRPLIAIAAAGLFLLLTVVCPVAFWWSLSIRKSLLYMNWMNLSRFHNLSNPETDFGLNCTRNFFITDEKSGIKVGTWHILPQSRIAECDLQTSSRLPQERAFADDRPVVLYLHGNGGARGGNHRRGLYKVLAYSEKLDFHVVTFDYRGYGDSTPLSPTASGLVDDAATAYDWLLNEVSGRRERILLWGHSLGTAVAVNLVARTDPISQPAYVVLEAPFNAVADAVRNHPMALLFSYHPLFEYFFVEPMITNAETNFVPEERVRHIHSHLMILHAEDDMIIPFKLGKKLYHVAVDTRPATAPGAQFVSFNASKKLGHKSIFRDEELPDIISKFVLSSTRRGSRM